MEPARFTANDFLGNGNRITEVTKLDKIRNESIRRATKLGRNHKESPRKEVEVVWACDEKRGAIRRKEDDGNESTGEKEDRKT